VGQIGDLVQKRERYLEQRLKATAAKIFIDGVIESHTAALLEPYLDRPGDRGEPILEAAEFNRLAVALDGAGFQIHVHAIGDRAVRMTSTPWRRPKRPTAGATPGTTSAIWSSSTRRIFRASRPSELWPTSKPSGLMPILI